MAVKAVPNQSCIRRRRLASLQVFHRDEAMRVLTFEMLAGTWTIKGI
jgi:hypothetical protein